METKYTIHIRTEKENNLLFYDQLKGFWSGVTANLRMATNDFTHIESLGLAEAVLACCLPVFDKWYRRRRYPLLSSGLV